MQVNDFYIEAVLHLLKPDAQISLMTASSCLISFNQLDCISFLKHRSRGTVVAWFPWISSPPLQVCGYLYKTVTFKAEYTYCKIMLLELKIHSYEGFAQGKGIVRQQAETDMAATGPNIRTFLLPRNNRPVRGCSFGNNRHSRRWPRRLATVLRVP